MIRDPLYGFISLSKIETNVIDSDIFKRLQHIKQLSHTYLVYPSATHTRFEHSLGTMHISDLMIKKLNIRKNNQQKIRLACLLHDVGHGPFSHLFENILKVCNPDISDPHEKISKMMLEHDSQLDRILSTHKSDIVELFDETVDPSKEFSRSLESRIVSSDLDADKFDYLKRDSYHIGVKYGLFDFDRILHTLTIVYNSHIGIDFKGKDAIENYRLARYLMHVQIYEHHARLAADQMFIQGLEYAIDEKVIDKDLLKFNITGDNTEFLKYYKTLDDYSIYYEIINNNNAKISKQILTNIKNRKLLKRICEFSTSDLINNAIIGKQLMKMSPQDFKNLANEITDECNLPQHEVIIHRSHVINKLFKKGSIYVKNRDQISDLEGFSSIVGSDTIKYLVFGPDKINIKAKICKIISKKFNLDVNHIKRYN